MNIHPNISYRSARSSIGSNKKSTYYNDKRVEVIGVGVKEIGVKGAGIQGVGISLSVSVSVSVWIYIQIYRIGQLDRQSVVIKNQRMMMIRGGGYRGRG